MPLNPIKVALIGANGILGAVISKHLNAHQAVELTVLVRISSKSPPFGHVVTIPDDFPFDSLVEAFQDHTAVIVAISGSQSSLQIRLADAAAQAGVRTFIPADFGSCDSSSDFAVSAVPVFAEKQKVRQHLQILASKGQMSWTSLVCGHFFDYGLQHGLLHIDLASKSALLFDGGNVKWSASTLDTIAKAVLKVLELESETRNRMLYIQSVCVSQNEVLDMVEQISGNRYERVAQDSGPYIQKMQQMHMSDPKDDAIFHQLCGVVGLVDANWEGKQDFANELLGLEKEDLYHVLAALLPKE